MIHTYLNWKTKNKNIPLDAEKRFSIQIADIPFNGSIDRVELTPDGELEIIDFKTGGVYETKKSIQDIFQMNMYAIATEKLYGKLPKSTSLFYLKKDKILTNSIVRLIWKWLETLSKIQLAQFLKKILILHLVLKPVEHVITK